MDPLDRLVLTCRGCGAGYVATRAQALKRFGERATSYMVEQSANCPKCGAGEIDVAVARATDPRALPAREAITFADIERLDLALNATCAPCRLSITPSARDLALHRTKPLGQVFDAAVIRCHRCGLAVCGISVCRPHSHGGGARETVHQWWEPGSPADPVVLAFWAVVRRALAARVASPAEPG